MVDIRGKLSDEDYTPYTITSLQESDRMNLLLREIRSSLIELELGISGQLNVSERMESLRPNFFSHSGAASRIRNTLYPYPRWRNVRDVSVTRKHARMKQTIPTSRPRDHIPLFVEVPHPFLLSVQAKPGPRFDRGLLTRNVMFGGLRREEF